MMIKVFPHRSWAEGLRSMGAYSRGGGLFTNDLRLGLIFGGAYSSVGAYSRTNGM